MMRPVFRHRRVPAVFAILMAVVSCKPAPKEKPQPEGGVLLQVGSEIVTRADLDYQLQEKHGGRGDDATRERALVELTDRARYSQVARDAGLDDDPLARAEIARILTTRLKEKLLNPKLKAAAAPVPEARLRELYRSGGDRFQSAEKRRVAVLWLDPGANPERREAYQEKMSQARDWLFNDSDLEIIPKGVSR